MKGSDKQVAWAGDLKVKVVKAIEQAIEIMNSMDAPAEKKAAAIAEQQRRLDKVNSIEYAGDMIDAFRLVDFSDIRKATAGINAAFRGSVVLR